MAYEPSEILYAAAMSLGQAKVVQMAKKIKEAGTASTKSKSLTQYDVAEKIHNTMIIPAIPNVIFSAGSGKGKKGGNVVEETRAAFTKKITLTGNLEDRKSTRLNSSH